MSSVGYVVTALGGVALGWLLFSVINRRSRTAPLPTAARGPVLESEVLRRSSAGYLVVNSAGRPLLSNGRAAELGVIDTERFGVSWM